MRFGIFRNYFEETLCLPRHIDGGIMRKFSLISLLLISLLTAPFSLSFAQQKSAAKTPAKTTTASSGLSTGNADYITAAMLKDYLYFIASDEMEGRDTPSRGLNTTAKFIGMNLARWGFKPMGDNGTFYQTIALRNTKSVPAESHAEMGSRKFVYGEDFLNNAGGTASGNLVFVGYGLVQKKKNFDSYAGVDVKDKIMVVATGALPKTLTNADLSGRPGEDWESPAYHGAKNGAKGIIYVPSFQTLSNWSRSRQFAVERGSTVVDKFQPLAPDAIPSITVSLDMLNAIFPGFRGEKLTAQAIFNTAAAKEDFQAFDLSANKKITFTSGVKIEMVPTQNVVGVLEGSDPVLKNEYVAVGAHYDHVGVGNPVNGDSIYNGADDDGSGTTAILSIAGAFANGATRPKRSILFVWHCGEEKGLWGSEYFTEYPTVPLQNVITQLNIDMIGRSKKEGDTNPDNKDLSGPNQIYVIGSKMMSTDLGALSESVNKSFLNIDFDYRYDDPNDRNRFFFRSDHFNYAHKGIPIIFYFDGVHEDYHEPSDTPDKIDYQKMEKVTRTVYVMAWALSNQAKRPVVDKDLPAELRR